MALLQTAVTAIVALEQHICRGSYGLGPLGPCYFQLVISVRTEQLSYLSQLPCSQILRKRCEARTELGVY